MIRAIMAAIGFLIVSITGEQIGILLMLPAIITIVVNIAKVLIKKGEEQQRWKEYEKEKNERQLEEERKKQEALIAQESLVEGYKDSPLVKDVLNTIRGGTTIFPEEIVITDNRISGRYRGNTYTYDFAANRVYALDKVIKTVSDEDELKYVLRPQVAMAEALNYLFGNAYIIYDKAQRRYCDEDSYTTTTYISDHVQMVLASTLPNKRF